MSTNQNCIESTSTNSNLEYTPHYSIKEVSEITGISAHTLRYYDKVHLFPFLQRDENNIRIFSDADIEWIHLIECLRKTNFSINEIKHYVDLNLLGDSTLEERYQIICNQESVLKEQLKDTKKSLEHLRSKKEYYQKQLKSIEK